MISFSLVESITKRLQEGTIRLDEAIRRLSQPCTCGIFNPTRADEILHEIVQNAV
jgi:hypothetical protein